MEKRIMIINGPNLNLLGKREPELYGKEDFSAFLQALRSSFAEIRIDYFQSNVEGELINKLHETGFSYDGIIINPGGYCHTSVSLADAISAIQSPVIEVHLTNLYRREEIRHVSLTAKGCVGVISGFGLWSYEMALQFFLDH